MNCKKLSLKSIAWLMILTILHGRLIGQVTRIDGTVINNAELTNSINQLVTAAKVAGLSVTVYNNNQVAYNQQFGFAKVDEGTRLTDSSTMYGASFSKAVFAYLVMMLVNDKVLDLDKPLVGYLPKPLLDYTFPGKLKDYKDLTGDDRYKKITARMCLDHTTGFPNFRWFEPDGKLRIKFEPGSRVSYSGEGMYLLQLVLQEIIGKDFETIAQQRIFQPLGMAHTSYVWRPAFEANLAQGHDSSGRSTGFPRRTSASAAGSLITTVADYQKFYTALLNKWNLPEHLWQEMTSSQIRIRSVQQFGPLSWKDSTLNDGIILGYGLGFGVFQTPVGKAFFKEGHDNGWGHYSVAFPGKETAVVIMTNSDNGEGIFRELLKLTIGDTYTPWYWENYLPWNSR